MLEITYGIRRDEDGAPVRRRVRNETYARKLAREWAAASKSAFLVIRESWTNVPDSAATAITARDVVYRAAPSASRLPEGGSPQPNGWSGKYH